jgi:hypothetical protein
LSKGFEAWLVEIKLQLVAVFGRETIAEEKNGLIQKSDFESTRFGVIICEIHEYSATSDIVIASMQFKFFARTISPLLRFLLGV